MRRSRDLSTGIKSISYLESSGDHPLAKEPEDSGYEIGIKVSRLATKQSISVNKSAQSDVVYVEVKSDGNTSQLISK